MRCYIDSNIFISAGLFPNSVPAAAIKKAISLPNVAFVSDYALDEMHRVIHEKFPHRIRDLETFLYRTLFTVQLVATPTDILVEESEVSDVKDRPILRAAISVNADVLITGDKQLLASDITPPPRIIKPTDFLNF
ncbi:MAG: putative toxin-antitoxin system toxin component, PIN family [Oscillospiraceae bacterium]|nr:putative toxin-antitoxin system toxin component, PIN family [Oscillospiraceae bacterium]